MDRDLMLLDMEHNNYRQELFLTYRIMSKIDIKTFYPKLAEKAL